MGVVSKGEGRTVLFVSHNMAAVKNLCDTGILLKNGLIKTHGNMDQVLNTYDLEFVSQDKIFEVKYEIQHNLEMQLLHVNLERPTEHSRLFTDDSLIFNFQVDVRVPVPKAYITLDIKDQNDELVYWTADYPTERFLKNTAGKFNLKCTLPSSLLTSGFYTATCAIYSPYSNKVIHNEPEAKIRFEIEEGESSFLHQFGISRPGKTGMESRWASTEIL